MLLFIITTKNWRAPVAQVVVPTSKEEVRGSIPEPGTNGFVCICTDSGRLSKLVKGWGSIN